MNTTRRKEQEIVAARVSSLCDLQTEAEGIVTCMQGQQPIYDPYDSKVKLEEWLKGSWHEPRDEWYRSKTGDLAHKRDSKLSYCISEPAIEYLLSISTNQIDFWSFVARLAWLYRHYIERMHGHNRAQYSSHDYDAEQGLPKRKLDLRRIPRLPVAVPEAREVLEDWRTFGEYASAELGGIFPGSSTDRLVLLTADLEKDLTSSQLLMLTKYNIVVLQGKWDNGGRLYTTFLHPLARAILTKEATNSQEKS